jgi:hypothetical protein
MNPVPGRDDGGASGVPAEDIELTADDLDDFIIAITAAFRTQAAADQVLRRIGYPQGQAPSFASDPANAWNEVFGGLANGIIAVPYRRLLTAALRVYGSNRVFLDLASRYLAADGRPRRTPPPPKGTSRSRRLPRLRKPGSRPAM